MNPQRDVLSILIILSQTLVAVVLITIIQASDNTESIKSGLPFWEALIIALAVLSIIVIRDIYSKAQESTKIKLMKEHLQEHEILMTAMHTEKHEFRRHLQALQSLIFLDRIDQAKQYIDGIAETYWNTDQGVYISRPELNSLVNSKLSLAQSQGIEFQVSSSEDFASLKIEPWDLCSIVGNLLDNAIEAAVQDKKQPWVRVEFDYQNNEFMVFIRNNGAIISRDDRRRLFEAGFTSKESLGRGYGLYIVQTLVSRYGGKIEVVSSQTTTIIVRIPKKEKLQ